MTNWFSSDIAFDNMVHKMNASNEEPYICGYQYHKPSLSHTYAYIWPTLRKMLLDLQLKHNAKRVFELGCGNGATAAQMTKLGFEVIGVDPSPSGIDIGKSAFPDLHLHVGSSDEDLAGRFGTFPVLVSLEVVEHVFLPRKFAASVFSLLEPGGTAILSTPYHGYLKNLALALTGKFDAHFTALWDYGHIKFWSMKTLGVLLNEAGFVNIRFYRVGRIPPLAKSMIAVATRPGDLP